MLTYLVLGVLGFAALQYHTADAQCTNGGSCSVSRPTCYARQYYYYSQRYTAYTRRTYYYYTSCGWWGWRRCRRTGYYRQSYNAYYRRGAYRQTSSCCTGYSGSPGSCNPICSGGNACQNGGTCVRPNTCCCARSGYAGSVCNNDCDECQLNYHGCAHGCVNTRGSFYCTCRTGYELASDRRGCNDINECVRGTHNCDQNCHNTIGSFYCSCNTGYFLAANGYSCIDINECTSNNGGCPQQCVNTNGGFRCACYPGYSGDGISCTNINECATNNGGCEVYCTDTIGSFTCSCNGHENLDSSGLFCVDHDECATGAHDCEQVCNNLPNYWQCSCNSGYRLRTDGRTCADINECLTNNGGCAHTCTNSVGSYACSCRTGYVLADNNHGCIDIDECLDPLVHACQHNCMNTQGSFHCYCNPGYTLDANGKTCTANPCTTTLAAPQDGTISCTGVATDDNCTFDCYPGFSLFGQFVSTCRPNGIWSYQTPLCTRLRCDGLPVLPDNGHVVSPCSDAFGQTCYVACNTGYSLERGTTNRTCTADPATPTDVYWTTDVTTFCGDVDECQNNFGGCTCEPNIPAEAGCFSQCNNTMGSYHCICTQGYVLEYDGLTCQDHDECALTDHGCEHECVNTHGTYMCICNWGYRLDPDMRGCSDIDECAEGISGCNQTCTNVIGNYSCSCEPNLYTLNADGHACDDVDECLTNNGGCDHFCHNYYGGHECSCRPGYTLQDDGRDCVADPCESIMAPQNGSIACTSGMVGGATDDNCTFACHFGFELENANHRTCLPNHTWSGVETYCRIKNCPVLQAIPDGTVRLPCATEYTSFCTMDCDPGYYLIGNTDRACFVVNNSTNEVNWVGQYAECNVITPCAPTPCQHDAPCYANGEDYYCNCIDTGYSGRNCEIGKVEFPLLGFPTLRPGVSSVLFTIFASPDDELILIPNALNCTFSPQQITITAPATSGQFSVTCWGVGVVTLTYTLDGASAGVYTVPPPSILYIIPDPRPANESSIFDVIGIPEGTLPLATDPVTGEASNPQIIPIEGDDGGDVDVSFSSTSGWCRNEDNTLSTSGVAYLDNAGIIIPIALQGATINTDTLEVDYTDPSTVNTTCSMNPNSFNAVDIQDFISSNSLANQYFDGVDTLTPSWLDFTANPQANLVSVGGNEFVVSIEPGSEVVERGPCSSLPIETENLCIVLPYTGSLQVTVGNFNITFESQNGVCFVSSVTAGATSPLFIGGFDSDTETDALEMLGFMQDLANNGWNADVGGVGLGTTGPVGEEMTFEPFRTPFGTTTGNLPAPDVWMTGNLDKEFGSSSTSGLSIELSGDAYLDVPDLANILDGPPAGSIGQWTCVATGSIGVNVNFEMDGNTSNVIINGNDTQILSIFGGFPRDPLTDPAGIFFRGTGQLSPDLFNQYSDDIDVYITLNENNEATGVGCIITGNIRITQALSLDNIDIEINTFNWSNDDPLWYRNDVPESQVITISRPEEEIVLNGMITILPDRGVYAEPSILIYYPSASGGSYTGFCYSRINVFGTSIDTVVTTIGYDVYISSPGAITIFDRYSAYLWCTATLEGVYSWENLRVEVTGYFETDGSDPEVGTFIEQITNNAWDGIMTKANISKQRHMSATDALNRADEALNAKKTERNAARAAYNNSIDTLAEANDNFTRTRDTLASIRQQVAAIQPQVDNIQTRLNGLCTPVECPATCLPAPSCNTCTDTIESQTFSECDNTCYEDIAREIDAGTKMVDCWEYGEAAFEQVEATCGWRSTGYIDYGCRSRRYNLMLMSSQESTCTVPANDYPYVADSESYDCTMPCESSPQLVNIDYTCCSTEACGMQLSEKDCLLFNQACMTFRDEALANGTHGMSTDVVTLLRMEGEAEQAYNAAVFSKMVAEQMVNNTRRMVNMLEDEYTDALATAVAARSQLSNITEDVTNYLEVYDYIQDLPDGNGLEIVNISFASFQNVSDPNSQLELDIQYTVGEESTSNYIEGNAYGTFDFSNDNVMDIVVFDVMATVSRSIFSQAQTVKRDASRPKRQQIVDPGSNTVLSEFQENCITLRNAEETLEDLVASLGRLTDSYQTSYSNLQSAMNEISMLQSTYSTSGVGNTMFVDNATLATLNDTDYIVNTDVAQALGIDVTTIRVSDNTDLMQARQIIDSQLNYIGMQIENLGRSIFVDWTQQIRSMILGAQTDNCFSFADCAALLVHEIRDILAASPADLVGSLPSTFEQTSQEFLEIATSSNLTISEAYDRSIAMGQVIARLQNISYWCATPPRITEQPQPFGLFTVGQYYFLTCSAVAVPAPTYSWWKDGELVPGATESTLVFTQLTLSDDGAYTCVASNLVHSVRSMPGIVKVQTFPTIVTQPTDFDTYVCSINGAVFQVNATGMPAPQYQWYFRHITSTVNNPINGATSSVLFIEQPQADNEGTYFCNVSNSRGSVLTDEVRLHLLEYQVTRLSALISFTISQCNGSNQDYVYTFDSPVPVDYSTAFYEVVVEALGNLTNIDLLDPLNSYAEFDITEYGGRVEIDVVTPAPEEDDSDCNHIVDVAEFLTTVSTQLNATLTMFRNEIASQNILFRINSDEYCVDTLSIQPDEPFCPGSGIGGYEGVLCPECPPGTYGNVEDGVHVCSECPKGMYQTDKGQTRCISCPANTTTQFTGTRSASRCYFPCEPGYYSIHGLETAIRGFIPDCKACAIGSYQPMKEQTSCIPCAEGENTGAIASTSREQCLSKCDPGCVNPEYGLAPCQKCAKGRYNSLVQSTFCLECPEEQSTLTFDDSVCGATSISDCKVVCLPGSYSMDQTGLAPCGQCAKDTYQEFSDQNDCLPCNDLFGTLGTGASHPDDCLKKCGPGNYSDNGFEPCTLCPQGYYQDSYEKYECIQCPVGQTTGYMGTPDLLHCVDANKIPSTLVPDPFPMNMSRNVVPAVPSKITGSSGGVAGDDARSHKNDTGREIGIVVGVAVVILIIIAVILISALVYFRSRGSDPVTVKHRQLTEDKSVLWKAGTGNLRVEPNNRVSRISTATDGFSNPVYTMEDAISTCETDNGDLVHNPVFMDDEMLQGDDSAMDNPLYQGDDVSMDNAMYDEVDYK